MNILVISTSLRSRSNSETLADAFIDGAKSAGNNVEKISLKDKSITFCKGCLACQKTLKCVIKDDAVEIAEKMKNADVLVFATPIYYYEMSGQMKTLLDRANPLYSSDYKFRDIYFLSTAAEDENGVDEKAINGLEGWIECFEKAQLKGTVFAGGVNDAGEIDGHKSLKTAFDMGAAIN
ncbi:MAG: flavodoxin family protein [Ruminococcus sp.]|nr:flavodoxin family protein [Ruminococcus sp.]